MRLPVLSFAALCGASVVASAADASITRVPLPGDGGWDYLTADVPARRLYVTHGTRVHVVDLDSRKLAGEIAPTPGVHGVAVAPDLGLGFVSDGGDATVTVFDTKTLARVRTLKVEGTKPDAILYEPFSKRVFTFNGDSGDTAAFDAATGKSLGSLPLGGAPEFAASDGAGKAYVNIEDKGEVVRFDPVALRVTARWPLAPAHTPTGLALDASGHRLFCACRSRALVILDSDTGAKVASLPIGGGVDAVIWDAPHSRAFASCGDGTVTEVRRDGSGHYAVARTLATAPGAKTLAYDAKTQTLWLSAAVSVRNPETKKTVMTPGSFGLLVLDVTEGKPL